MKESYAQHHERVPIAPSRKAYDRQFEVKTMDNDALFKHNVAIILTKLYKKHPCPEFFDCESVCSDFGWNQKDESDRKCVKTFLHTVDWLHCEGYVRFPSENSKHVSYDINHNVCLCGGFPVYLSEKGLARLEEDARSKKSFIIRFKEIYPKIVKQVSTQVTDVAVSTTITTLVGAFWVRV